jgi:hypothetical protein
MSANQGTLAISTVLVPLVEKAVEKNVQRILEQNTAIEQALLIEMKELSVRLTVIEQLLSDKRKPINVRADKKAGDAPAETADKAVAKPGNFANNKMVYFREQYKNCEEYRKKYTSDALQAAMDADGHITSKNGEQKTAAQSKFAWAYIKNSEPDLFKQIGAEYDDAKKQFEASLKPPQQTAEANTP